MKNTFRKSAIMATVLGALILSQPQASYADGQSIKITQLGGSSAVETAQTITRYAKGQYDTVYIASSSTFADALAGGVLTGENKAAIFFTDGTSLDSESLAIAQKASKVYILGGSEVVSEALAQTIGNVTGRIMGSDRYDTAIKIAETLGTDRNIAIVNGHSFADALSATAMSITENKNILLVRNDALPEATKSYLATHGTNKEIVFVGGTGAISEEVREQVYAAANKDPKTSHDKVLAGKDRYETSLAVASRYGNITDAILTSSENYTDAIAASNLSATLNAPVVIVPKTGYEGYLKGLNHTALTQLTLLGGENTLELSSAVAFVAEKDGIDANNIIVHDASGNAMVRLSAEEAVVEAPVAEEAPAEKPAEQLTEKPAEEPVEEIVEEIVEEKAPAVSKAQAFMDAAVTMKGWSYSQSKRMSEGYADCSALVLKALRKAGLDTTGANLTSSSIRSDSRFYKVSLSDLKPGDVLWHSGHVAIYMGDNQIFEAQDFGVPVGYFKMRSSFSAAYRIAE